MTKQTTGVRAAPVLDLSGLDKFATYNEDDPYERIETALCALRGLTDLITGKKPPEYGVPCRNGDLGYLLYFIGREIEAANRQYAEQDVAAEQEP